MAEENTEKNGEGALDLSALGSFDFRREASAATATNAVGETGRAVMTARASSVAGSVLSVPL